MRWRIAALVLAAGAAVSGCASSSHPNVLATGTPLSATTTASPVAPTSPSQTARPTPSVTASSTVVFVGTRQGRVALFGYPSGQLVRYLTSGAGASYPTLAGGVLFWVQATGSCSSEVVQQAGGQAARTVASGGLITDLAVSADGKALAWQQHTGCTAQAALRVQAPGVNRSFAEPNPPLIGGAPSWALDDTHLVYFLRTGNAGGDYAIDVRTAHSLTDGASFSDPSCFPYQPRFAADGRIFVLTCPANAGPGLRQATVDMSTGSYVGTSFTAAVNPASVTSFSVGTVRLFQSGATVYGWSGGAVRVVPCGCLYPSA